MDSLEVLLWAIGIGVTVALGLLLWMLNQQARMRDDITDLKVIVENGLQDRVKRIEEALLDD